MRDLKARFFTALVFVSVMIGGILTGEVPAIILFGAVLLRCLWEFYQLTLSGKLLLRVLAILPGLLPYGLAAVGHLTDLDYSPQVIPLALVATFFVVTAVLLIAKSPEALQKLAFIALGTMYLGIPFAGILWIAFPDGIYHPNLLLGLLFLTWINDTGAYVVGSLVGKKPLMPSISPKKTLEGTLGGLFFNLLFSWPMHALFPELSVVEWAGMGLIATVFGTLGDLTESLFKRSLQVKDSGNILPGHGGFLDRFDAFIFILPFAAIYLTLIHQ
ncbi:MAG: phosphatidate cytidylyltransferase [Saprospiraceae bacterium]|jgi:phosphatidate cytidylyltransferase|nr:phosphatidate cytidylyltransferase [Saprospiraceae bacterium]MDP4821724.1 phosphatidate cytidylyltransferase [Saprospiraceae bacterium]MDP4998026.1 phosphatidate cytidylyltransferase [Saprospiraceae bacterium]